MIATLSPSRPSARLPQMPLITLAALAVALAYSYFVQPDRIVSTLALGSPAACVAITLGAAVFGLWLAPQLGLSLNEGSGAAPLLAGVGVAATIAIWCAGVDRVFAAELSPAFLHTMREAPLVGRIAVFGSAALFQSVLYRLCLGPAITWALCQLLRIRAAAAPGWVFLAGFTLAQLVNIAANAGALAPHSPIGLAYLGLRLLVPGASWGLSYWRFGFKANEYGVAAVHLIYQPLAGLLLSMG